MTGVAEAQPQESVRDLLRIRDFRMLWLGQIVSNFGDAVTALAVLILINDLTDGSATAIALAAIVQAVPRMTIGLVAGVYVDRLDRKRIMIVSDLLRAVLVLGLIAVTTVDDLWLLYVLSFVLASVSSFFMPARTAYIPLVVPRSGLLAANSLAQMSMVVMGVVGAGVAGWLIGVLGAYWSTFVIDAATFLLSAALIARVATPGGGSPAADSGARAVVDDMMAGFRVMASSRVLVGVLSAMAVTMLGLGMVNVLIVPMTINELGVAATWFGAIQFSQSLSMVLSGALLAVLAARFKATRIVSVTLLLTGLAVALLSQVQNVWGLILILFCVGWFVTPLQAALTTLLQTSVSESMLGRAGAALATASQASSVISMAVAGLLADAIGTRNVFVIGGGFGMLAGVLSAVIFRGQDPSVAEDERAPPPADATESAVGDRPSPRA